MSDFEDIRPYHDEEVEDALAALVRDPELTDFLAGWLMPAVHRFLPRLTVAVVSLYLRYTMRGVKNIRGFQNMVAAYAKKLVREGTTEFRFEGFDRLEPGQAYLFVSNHRDIAGDSMLLDYALYLSGMETVRIAIGDNLIQRDFATSLMRLNKGFFIKRSEQGHRAAYAALLQSSQFISASIRDGHSVWIAQSEGRSKDGFDLTDPAIIKMFALARRKRPLAETVQALNIVPLSISYEFDPCDVLKAKELGSLATEGAYVKPPGEDLLSLVKGLSGHKGQVVLRLGKMLDGDFESVEAVAHEIDRQILSQMEMFPVNYWALSKIDEPEYFELSRSLLCEESSALSRKDELALTARLKGCPPAYREYFLKMYANPLLNRHRTLNQTPPAAAPE